MPVLSEIKVRSPKDGDLLRGRAPEMLAGVMAACPIAGLSVVTEAEDFGGSLDIVRRVRPMVGVPILRKDFLDSEDDLDETVAAGADAVLLTVCMQEDEPLARLHAAARERGLETLVEVHDEDDVRRLRALGLRPDVLGINNRDILVREVDDGDVTVTERLAALFFGDTPDPGVPGDTILLSESAIAGPEDAVRAREAGAGAVLVGTSILQAPDPGA
ncbi:MAG: indole-3-glycerol-phosphate synthase, partial [Acidimicrobiia bacterium]